MKLSKSYLYWLLQILGWGIPFVLNALGKLFLAGFELSTSYVLFENATLMVIGIVVSHFFRFVYKHYIKRTYWSFKKFLLTAVLLIACATAIFLIVELICSFWYELLEKKTWESTTVDYVVTYINSLIYLLVWFMLYLLVNYILRNQQMKVERLKLENIAKESQLNTLKGQINPHFMFNSLNNIRGLMLEDVEKARDMLTQLSEMLRFSLSRKDNDQVPLAEEIAVVNNYIALSKIQLEDRLHYEELIATDVLHLEVPPMLIQMLIENAIKHGIATLKNGGGVRLEITRSTTHMIILVTNDGNLTSNTAGTQIGVENIKQRLQLLYDDQAGFQLVEKDGKVIAKVEIPIL